MNPTNRRNTHTHWLAAMRTQGHSRDTIRRRLGTLNRIERDLSKPLETLTTDEITAWLARWTNSGTRSAYFGDLRAYFSWLRIRHDLGPDADLAPFRSPLAAIRRPRQPKRLPRPISTEHLYLALDTATGDVLDWILLGAYQACRVGDAAAVAGQDVSDGSLRFPAGKGGLDRTIPLHPELRAVADRRPAAGWWFPSTGASGHITAHTVAERVCAHFDHLGVPDFTYHRLRHWCGTEMLRAGASLPEVQKFLRHEVITSTVLYTQVLHDELAVAAGRLPRRRLT